MKTAAIILCSVVFTAFVAVAVQVLTVRVHHDGRCGVQEWVHYVLWMDDSEREYDEFGIAERWRRAHKRTCDHIWIPGPMGDVDDSGYWPPLQYAIARGLGIARIRDVIRSDPGSAKASDKLGRTALHWAAVYPDPQKRETLKKLLEDAGADATAKDEDGLTARDWESQSADSNEAI